MPTKKDNDPLYENKLLSVLDLGIKDYNLRMWKTSRGYEVGADHDPSCSVGWFSIFKDLDLACNFLLKEACGHSNFREQYLPNGESFPKMPKQFLLSKKLLNI
jgi:hypothetical protein